MVRFFTLAALLLSVVLGANAQSADKLYEEGKALYDADKFTQAIAKLKPAAEKGHKKAQYYMGRCYDKGHGVTEDDKIAFSWYMKAAKQGHAKSQYQVGKCYKDGEGVEKDKKQAFSWFSRAAAQDNAKAQLALGKAYMKGKGVASDQAKAKSWLKKAVTNEKDGDEILEELRKDKAAGDEDAKQILQIVGK
jgi:TPR repeat protein